MNAEQIVAMVQEEIKKAVTQTTYTFNPLSRSIFSPENIDPVIRVISPVATPVRDMIPRKGGLGEAAGWKMLTSRLDPQAGGTGVSVGFADASTPSSTNQTYVFKTAAYKNLGRDVEIGRQQIAANRGANLEDIRTKQEAVKATEVLLGEESMILVGSSAANALEFDGLTTSIVTNSGSVGAYVTASGIGTLCTTLFNAGSPGGNLFVANAVQGNALANSLSGTGALQRALIDDQGAVTAGYRLTNIVNPLSGGLIKYQPSRYIGTWGLLLTIKDVTGENWLEVEDLDPMSVYDVPTANHSVVSRVFETAVLKNIAEVYQYKVSGLSLT